MAADAWTSFQRWADGVTRTVVGYTNPGLVLEARGNHEWPLTRLDHAMVVVALYLAWLGYGLLKWRAEDAARKGDGAATGKKAAGKAVVAGEEDGGEVTWSTVMAHPATALAPIMADRVKMVQTVYNVVQVALSGYMMVASVWYARAHGYGLVCNPFIPGERDITFVHWVFYVSKAFDFMDTVFMVLRSKWRQFSFLHTYHHVSVFGVHWWVAATGYTGDIWFPVFANALVHTIMYFYYLSTCFGIRPAWGKRLTEVQMLQFVIMVAHGVVMLANDCPYPPRVTITYISYMIVMLILFGNFYVRKHYCKARQAQATGATTPTKTPVPFHTGEEEGPKPSKGEPSSKKTK